MSKIVIDCDNLSKRYGSGDVYALRDLTIQVREGEVYGFLGPNGAGKSTAIRTLMNFLQPTSGSAKILGLDVVEDSVEIKKQIGYQSSDLNLYPKLTGKQLLDYMEDLQPADSPAYRQELIKRFKADIDKPLGDLSRGNKQKIGLIQAFMHKPAVVILDEPTSGLDPLMQEVFCDLLNETTGRGGTVFMSSHILAEVQKMCDRVAIIRDGKLVAEKQIDELSLEAAQTFDITFASKPPVAELKKLAGIQNLSVNGNQITLHMHGELSPLFALLAKYQVTQIDTRNLDLEEVFLQFYQDKGGAK